MAGSRGRPGRKESFSTRTPEQVRWDWVTLWLQRAENDLRSAELIIAGSLTSYETASFHAQQAVEKALKAILIRHQIEFERTHNLAECASLTTYAVEARYPGGPAVEKPEASRHLSIARESYRIVRGSLDPYLEAGRPNG
ncbi:MAG: HEPN domain-containing protein [Candidatus Rokubacteria bacterium]|nr:HEPN domain-containing protein [Candidatus Rokubacteria bacterium]